MHTKLNILKTSSQTLKFTPIYVYNKKHYSYWQSKNLLSLKIIIINSTKDIIEYI